MMPQLPAARLTEIRRSAENGWYANGHGADAAVADLLDEIDALRAALDEVPGYPALLAYDAGAPDYGESDPAVTLVRAVQTCYACPAQWDAWDADGQTYYLRFRSGLGTVEAVDTPTTTAESLDSARLIAEFQYGDSLLGSIELDLFCRLAGIRLAENAEAEED
jgi:hypothetical protein